MKTGKVYVVLTQRDGKWYDQEEFVGRTAKTDAERSAGVLREHYAGDRSYKVTVSPRQATH